MKTIGIIDYYVSEWHANKYHSILADCSAAVGEEFKIAYAYGDIDVSLFDNGNNIIIKIYIFDINIHYCTNTKGSRKSQTNCCFITQRNYIIRILFYSLKQSVYFDFRQISYLMFGLIFRSFYYGYWIFRNIISLYEPSKERI